jgi:hypothetical protein
MKLTRDERKEIMRTHGNKFIPSKFLKLAEKHEFIDAALIDRAMTAGDYPARPHNSGNLKVEDEATYTEKVFAYLKALAETAKLVPVEVPEPARPDLFGRRRVAAAGKGPRPARSTPPPDGMVRLTVNVPAELHYRLRMEAFKRKITLTELILRAAGREVDGG